MVITVEIPDNVAETLERIGILAKEQGYQAFAVGGCVRDWCLGISENPDIDITSEGEGIALARAAQKFFGGSLVEHTQFGTATLCMEKAPALQLDFASCRKEVYAKPAAYPKVSRGTLDEDLARRDFTINAMALCLDPDNFGVLVDPYEGLEDLKQAYLRVLHDQSFVDDPSRILRGIRFAVRFDLAWEPKTLKLINKAIESESLGLLNAGRLQKEFDLMDQEPDPSECFRVLDDLLSQGENRQVRGE